jgi:hypothetical protein
MLFEIATKSCHVQKAESSTKFTHDLDRVSRLGMREEARRLRTGCMSRPSPQGPLPSTFHSSALCKTSSPTTPCLKVPLHYPMVQKLDASVVMRKDWAQIRTKYIYTFFATPLLPSTLHSSSVSFWKVLNREVMSKKLLIALA